VQIQYGTTNVRRLGINPTSDWLSSSLDPSWTSNTILFRSALQYEIQKLNEIRLLYVSIAPCTNHSSHRWRRPSATFIMLNESLICWLWTPPWRIDSLCSRLLEHRIIYYVLVFCQRSEMGKQVLSLFTFICRPCRVQHLKLPPNRLGYLWSATLRSMLCYHKRYQYFLGRYFNGWHPSHAFNSAIPHFACPPFVESLRTDNCIRSTTRSSEKHRLAKAVHRIFGCKLFYWKWLTMSSQHPPPQRLLWRCLKASPTPIPRLLLSKLVIWETLSEESWLVTLVSPTYRISGTERVSAKVSTSMSWLLVSTLPPAA